MAPKVNRILYKFAISHYCEKARWGLEFKGLRHERREVLLWLLQDAPDAPGDTARVLRSALVDPDWEVLLWRLLRTFLPLVDPQWLAAHQLEPEVLPEEFLERERRQIESLGCQLTDARPGLVGERPPAAMAKPVALSRIQPAAAGR